MSDFTFPYALFRRKLDEGGNVYEMNFYIENDKKYEDCWIGFNTDFEKPYWFGLTADGRNAFEYKTADEILNAKVFDGKSMQEIWNKVYFVVINGVDAKAWFLNECVAFYTCRLQDAGKTAKLAAKLWSDSDYEELKAEFETLTENENNIVFTAYEQENMIAFAHCAVRNEYVEGADTGKTAYLEGIYVEKEYRRCGIASQLIT